MKPKTLIIASLFLFTSMVLMTSCCQKNERESVKWIAAYYSSQNSARVAEVMPFESEEECIKWGEDRVSQDEDNGHTAHYSCRPDAPPATN